jgi:ABC-type multidrug transport system fused ATPase/permease subunit
VSGSRDSDILRVLLRRHTGRLIVVLALSALLAAATLIGQWVYGTIFDVLLPTRDAEAVARALGVIAVVAALGFVGGFGSYVLTMTLRISFVRDLRAVVLDRTLDLPHHYFAEQTTGVILLRLIPDLDSLSHAVAHLVTACAQGLQLLVILGVIAFVDPHVALVSLAAMAGYLVCSALIGPRASASLDRKNLWRERRSAFSLSILPAIKDIKCLGLQRQLRDDHARLSHEGFRDSLKSAFWESLLTIGCGIPPRLGVLGVLAIGFSAVADSRQTPGMVMTLAACTGALIWPLASLFRSLSAARLEWLAVERVRRHLEMAPEPSGTHALATIRRGIRVSHLTYAHAACGPATLADLSVEFPAGTFTAVVGKSGSGKTTLLQLLVKIHPCPPNSVFIDDHDVTAIDNCSLRTRIGYVGQEPLLFVDTLRSNIDPHDRLGDAELRRICALLSLDTLVDRLPDGLGTMVAENGANLSGGERQRVGIARAWARGAQVLILDEATAAVDEEVESRIIEALRDWMGANHGTIVAVTHSPAMTAAADRVVRLDQGRGLSDRILAADAPDEATSELAGAAQVTGIPRTRAC